MKAVVLVAGYATRLYPLTANFPKALLPISKEPILTRLIRKVAQVPGVTEAVVVSNSRFFPLFLEWSKGVDAPFPIRVLDDKTSSPEGRLGSVGDLAFAIENGGLEGNDLLVLAGDNVFDFSLAEMARFQKGSGYSAIAVYDIGNPKEAAGKFGVVSLRPDGLIDGFFEKPADPKSSFVSTACYIFSKRDASTLKFFSSLGKGHDHIGEFVKDLLSHTKLVGYVAKGSWFDVGSLEDYEAAKRYFGDKSPIPKSFRPIDPQV